MIRIDHQAYFHSFGAYFQIVCTLVILFSLWSTCKNSGNQATISEVFFGTYNGTGFSNYPYVVLIGTLSALYSLVGYEAAGHMAEETVNAGKSVPCGILYTIIGTSVCGFIYIISLLFATAHNVDFFVKSDFTVTDVFKKCSGNEMASILTVFIICNMFFSGMSSETVTVRLAFALARDGGFPYSKTLRYVDPRTRTPIYSVVLVFLTGVVLLLLDLVSTTAFTAVTSISTIGYQISYAIPIILRITYFRNRFIGADFQLGKYSFMCGLISSIFLVFTSILFTFPTEYPITIENFNYSIFVFIGFAGVATSYWVCHAQYMFKGPRIQNHE
jgi:amino acid transporter